jgi:hypothetical protein
MGGLILTQSSEAFAYYDQSDAEAARLNGPLKHALRSGKV